MDFNQQSIINKNEITYNIYSTKNTSSHANINIGTQSVSASPLSLSISECISMSDCIIHE